MSHTTPTSVVNDILIGYHGQYFLLTNLTAETISQLRTSRSIKFLDETDTVYTDKAITCSLSEFKQIAALQ